MIPFQVLYLLLEILTLSPLPIVAQSSYAAYQISFPLVTSCPNTQYFDTAIVRCSTCPTGSIQDSTDNTRCLCSSNSSYYGVNQGGGSITCVDCGTGFIRSSDGYGCVRIPITACGATTVSIESNIRGELFGSGTSNSSSQPRVGNQRCETCVRGTAPDSNGQRCVPCASITPRTSLSVGATIECCNSSSLRSGICLNEILRTTGPSISTPDFSNRFGGISLFIQQNIEAAFYLCRMNLDLTTARANPRSLLSNATACQILGNIATMQLYSGLGGQAYNIYDTYIWQGQLTSPVWAIDSIRYSIPFLAYPTTYYEEINSVGYNWIPSTYKANSTLDLRFAKYSPLGKYIGLVHGVDGQMQLCRGGYSDGRGALTFATLFRKFCNIRASALWNLAEYETAFYDPYLVFTRSGVLKMIPTPVVIVNYIPTLGSTTNRNGDESLWTYHRRFFLVDRVSGIGSTGELSSIRYAKAMRLLITLTPDTNFIQPPVLVIEYDEITSADVLAGKVVQVTFESEYRTNQDLHIRDIWIAAGILAAAGFVFGLLRFSVRQSRRGKMLMDIELNGLMVIVAYISNALANAFFIVMTGVALWWLIFFKSQDSIYTLLPSGYQQVSYMSLVILAFILKSFDIVYLIVHQCRLNLFFIDWEKPREEKRNVVSMWRTYFIANEFSELQTFRRIHPTFHMLFVLFLLKVVNLESIAANQPGSVLFPSEAEYQAVYNPILRIGIAFSMWTATALVMYLYYTLFHRYFIEDRMLNFIDLCSISNISVIMFEYENYGYYIHGRSPHGTSDVNLKNMVLNLEREALGLIGTRSLKMPNEPEPKLRTNITNQTFIIHVNSSFSKEYGGPLKNYANSVNNSRNDNQITEDQANRMMNTYRTLNEFLCSFIDHSLVRHDYKIRHRTFLGRLLDSEFQNPQDQEDESKNIFFIDRENAFTSTIFYGYEHSLMIWNASTFFFVDFFAQNYVTAAVLTYLLNLLAEKLRASFGRRVLSRETLIPKKFLF